MSLKSHNTGFRRLSFAAIAAFALGSTTLMSASPADAAVRVFAGHHGLHVAVVNHPHHDWWRWHHHYDHHGW